MWCAHLRSFALICAQSRSFCAPTALFLRSNCEHLERKKSAVGRSGSALRPYCAHTAKLSQKERKKSAKRAQLSAVERSMSASNCAHAKKHGLSQYGRSESAVRARLTAMGAQQERDFCLAVKVDFAHCSCCFVIRFIYILYYN